MESHDIVRDEKLLESDEISNKDVEMKCEMDEKEDQKGKQQQQQLLQQQQQEYNCHDEIQEPEELIESEIATLLARNHQINMLQNEKLKQSSINNVNNDNQELSNESHELKHVVFEEQEDEQIKNEELSDNNNMKQENIVNSDINEGDDRDEDREEEKEEEYNDKNLEKEKCTQGQDVSEDNPQFDRLSLMGRNRRVRQKNRYFLDFHCVDLTKGARSNKDDYDGFTTTTTSTRSSNRRSTTDSNRGQQDETDGIELRYCRKCSAKTMHDVDGGCQPCLYKKIVESSKRQRPGGQRNRSNNSRQHHQHQQQQNDNEIELSSNATTNKRKATRQGGGSKINGNQSSNINTNSNNNNNNNNTNNININTTTTTTTTAATNVTEDTNVNNDNIVGITTNDSGIDKLPKLDSWTPDEVAEFILSKGFTQEAELFKMQSVDGISLLLMQRTDFTYGLKIKLGPALKIYDQVCKLKKEYFRSVATTN